MEVEKIAVEIGGIFCDNLDMNRFISKQISDFLELNSAAHFAIDSRQVRPGGLFFALRGEKVDGHRFLQDVAAKGALGAVVSSLYTGADFGLELLRVEDVQQTLQELAKSSFLKRKERVIGITGSMGKTTTKEFLATILEKKFRVAKTEGSQNTQLTLPLTVLNLQGEYDVLILEMGMSEKGQIARLVDIAPPDLAIVTRIAPAGIVGGDLHEIAEAKAEIFSHMRTKWGIISSQAAQFESILYAGNVPKWIYGPDGDFSLKELEIKLPFEAEHLKENALGAIAAARYLGLSWYEIECGVRELKPYERRFEKIEKDGITFIQDCYNANPDSMSAALKNLPKPQGEGRVIGILGAMADLGRYSAHYHKRVGMVAKEHLDYLFSIGKEAEGFMGAEHFSDLAEIKKRLETFLRPGDVVLIKGSNGLKLWEILED